ncbi:DUF5709 domain-containing protein [Nocardioides sp. cx-169]|uniref:DUF5709 domain-containing protein n=1 Tax=Nocardioides sp. cx-169 TaxID=2899080 RepID=UPI001E49E8A2|nr:DUF5709 domain-containing protein [Nocardioides sp. cx-169]MCD4534025.1 DUF5709 domain-containing protein [Nocardioides sp. cx-169]
MTENGDTGIDAAEPSGENENYHGYSVDDEDQPQGEGDSLVDDRGLVEPLDEGYSPPEKWSAAQGYGNTPLEESLGETLDQRVAQEVPEPDPYEQAELEGSDLDRDATDETIGEARAGRLVAPDEGVHEDREPAAVAEDVGIDGAGAAAEEAAMHIVDEP